MQTADVTNAINKQQIHYRLIKAVSSNPRVNLMESIFEKNIYDFDSTEITAAEEMNIKVSDMIIREIMPI